MIKIFSKKLQQKIKINKDDSDRVLNKYHELCQAYYDEEKILKK